MTTETSKLVKDWVKYGGAILFLISGFFSGIKGYVAFSDILAAHTTSIEYIKIEQKEFKAEIKAAIKDAKIESTHRFDIIDSKLDALNLQGKRIKNNNSYSVK